MKRHAGLTAAVLICSALAVLCIGCKGFLWPFGPVLFPSIYTIWPNDDGTTWTYDYIWRIFQGYEPPRLYDTPEEVPPVPPLRKLAASMDHHPVGDNPDVEWFAYWLEFDGMITTASGVTAQYLKETFATTTTNEIVGEGIGPGEAFCLRLAAARPDLRRPIIARLAANGAEKLDLSTLSFDAVLYGPRNPVELLRDDFGQAIARPILIHGYAWERTDGRIGTYGDLDQLLAYKFLDANLLPGHEFTHQLVPSLADDVFLHCRILRRFCYRTPLGTFRNAIECLYAIDYGIAVVDGIDGADGYYRLFDYGTVIYAPYVGPVYSYERNLVQPGEPLSIGVGDKTLRVISLVDTYVGKSGMER